MRTERCKTLRLAYSNAIGVRSKKFELKHYLNQHGVDMCFLSETLINLGENFQLTSYACHRTGRLTVGAAQPSWSAFCIVHHSVPVTGLTHLKAIAIQVQLAGKPVITTAAYISPFHPLFGMDVTTCFGGDCRF